MNKSEQKIYELLKSNVLFRDEKGIYTIFPQRLLIEASGKSERTVQRAIKGLEEQRYICCELNREVNIMKLYFSQKEDLKNTHIIDRRKSDTSLSENDTSPSENCTSPSENDTSPSENDTSPSENDTSPSENCPSPSENCPSPSENCTSPSENCPSPSENDTSPSENRTSSFDNINEILEKLPTVKRTSLPNKYYLPTYKINDVLFSGDFPIGIEKKVGMTSEKDKHKGKLAYTLLMLNFDELGNGVKISRELTAYDQQVWNACTNLMINNYDIITPSQIYRWMGYEKKMSQTDKDRIMESINTIIRARVSINNENERKLYPKYPEISINEPLLAATIRTAKYGNNEVTAIKILSMPELFGIAEERGQVTTIPFELLEVPISKTDDNLQLLKHDSDTSRKILLNAVHSKCKIEDKKQKQRLPEKLQRILGHYKSIGWIADYNLTDSQIEIKLPQKK